MSPWVSGSKRGGGNTSLGNVEHFPGTAQRVRILVLKGDAALLSAAQIDAEKDMASLIGMAELKEISVGGAGQLPGVQERWP